MPKRSLKRRRSRRVRNSRRYMKKGGDNEPCDKDTLKTFNTEWLKRHPERYGVGLRPDDYCKRFNTKKSICYGHAGQYGIDYKCTT